VKKSLTLFITALSSILLSGCLDNGSSAAPPTNMVATAGDGRVKVTWTGSSGVDYWLFTATDAALSAFNWTGLPNAQVAINASSPFYLCGLPNGIPFYFAVNGRINGGPGGASSATVSGTPRFAGATGTWVPAPTATNNLLGVGYVSLTTCSNPTISAAGSFATVGEAGTIFTSQTTDGLTPIIWTSRSVTGGFTTPLNAVAGYAANQNNPSSPGLRWVAVGDGGATVISTDGINWAIGTPYNSNSAANPSNQALRSVIQIGGTFLAAGDAGTILSSTDGFTWTARTSNTTNNLHSITYGNGMYVAVGDNGTIRISTDGITWATPAIPTITDTLRQVSSVLTTFVAVGDNGTIMTSLDQGSTWIKQPTTPLGTPNFVGIASQGVSYTNSTAGIIAVMQFLALDSNGNYYTSQDGISWTTAGISTGLPNLNALVNSGFGYVAVGNAGATVSAF
jgi:photosystem II stability/assembly factor-like uncharacterized protein